MDWDDFTFDKHFVLINILDDLKKKAIFHDKKFKKTFLHNVSDLKKNMPLKLRILYAPITISIS